MIDLKEKSKILVMFILLAIAFILTYYFHAILRTGIIFSHFFYIPIIVASLWWKRKGLIVVIFLAALLIVSDVIFKMSSYDDIPRIFMLMVIGLLVALLSERLTKSEGMVNGRTNELRESEAKYRTLYESSSDAIMLLDEKGFFDCNNATLLIFGFLKKEDFIKVHPANVSPPNQPDGVDSMTAANNKISEAFRKGMNRFEWMHRRNNGEDFPAEVLLTAFQFNDKQVLQATVRDITERKRAEEELIKYRENLEELVKERTAELQKEIDERKVAQLEREQFYKFFRISSDLMAIADPNGCFKKINPACLNVLGYSETELLAKPFIDFVYPDDRQQTLDEMAKQIQLGFSLNFENRYLCKDGTTRWLSWRANYDKNEGITYATARDITERRLAEEELKKYREHLEELVNERTREVILAKEEAEHANMAKTNFLETMSHELRTPLNAILGFSEMLKQKMSGELNEKQEQFVDNIITGGNNLHNILGQILDIIQMDQGTIELNIENIPVPETVNELIGVIKEKAEKKNVLIEKNFDPELEYINADKQKVKQVFLNLLDNAVKFSKPEGGTITITAKKEGDMARFSVTDTGIGIKEDDVGKLFQKFTQLETGSDRKYGGTGIGLAISKQFVELHGGRIWAQSKYGEGSTFTFLIPFVMKKMGVI